MLFPQRYWLIDGRRVLIGLSADETAEFERLDHAPLPRDPLDRRGSLPSWRFEGDPTATADRRWLALFEKHEAAFRRRGQFRPLRKAERA